jgi:hypothetical protein
MSDMEKLVNKYTIEMGNYDEAIKRGGQFTEFNMKKSAEFKAKIDALCELDMAA